MSAPACLTTPLLPFQAGSSGVSLARGVQAGNWVFASGVLPVDFGQSGRPLSGQPAALRQAQSVWRQAARILHSGGAGTAGIVRCDQFFQNPESVPFFHQARKEACGGYIAPSTSVLVPELLMPGAAVCADLVAVAAGGPCVEPIFPDGLDIPATSSFAPVVKAGGLVFVAGFMAAHQPGDLGGIAPEARVPAGHLWKGNRIQLETQYLIRHKLVPALRGAGLSLADVVKANVYLSDIEDVPAFNQVWAAAFGQRPPATVFVPTSTPGFAIGDARIEINLVAAADSRSVHRIEAGDAPFAVCEGHPLAMRAEDLLIFSGLAAADESGLIEAARYSPRDRYLASPIEAEMEHLLDIVEAACRRNGASLRDVVRIQQLHTRLEDFLPACRVWQRRLPGVPLPISAVQVPAPIVVPGCSVQLDIWVYAP